MFLLCKNIQIFRQLVTCNHRPSPCSQSRWQISGCDRRSDGPRDTASTRREKAGRGTRPDQSFNYSSRSRTRCRTPAKGRWIRCSGTRPLIERFPSQRRRHVIYVIRVWSDAHTAASPHLYHPRKTGTRCGFVVISPISMPMVSCRRKKTGDCSIDGHYNVSFIKKMNKYVIEHFTAWLTFNDSLNAQ